MDGNAPLLVVVGDVLGAHAGVRPAAARARDPGRKVPWRGWAFSCSCGDSAPAAAAFAFFSRPVPLGYKVWIPIDKVRRPMSHSDAPGQFPRVRMRRMRRDAFSRRMMRETTLTPDDFIYPMFVMEGTKQRVAIPSMPGIERVSVDELVREAEASRAARHSGARAVPGHARGGQEPRRSRGLEPARPRTARRARDQEGGAGTRA